MPRPQVSQGSPGTQLDDPYEQRHTLPSGVFQITRRSDGDYPHGPLFHMRNAGHLLAGPSARMVRNDRRTRAEPTRQP